MKRVLIANSNDCRIYNYEKNKTLSLIKEINHPENKLKSKDLGSDRPGHYIGGKSARGAFANTDLQEVNIDNFARELADELDKERNNHEYDELVVIMPPHMDGLFFKYLNPNVKALITQTFQKNLSHYSDHDVLDYLKQHSIR